MNERWTGQTVTALLGLHLLVAVAVAAVLIVLVTHWHRVRIRRAQVTAVRVAIAGWLTLPPVSPPPGDGISQRTHLVVNGRHGLAA